MRLFQVDVACGGIEGGAAAGLQVGTQELVDAGGGPAVVGVRNQALDDRFHDRAGGDLEEAEFGADELQRSRPLSFSQPGQRGGEEGDLVCAVAVVEAELEGHAAAHAVADHVRLVDPELVHKGGGGV